MQPLFLLLLGIAILAVSFTLLKRPMRLASKLLLNTVLGFVFLAVFNVIGASFGIGLGVSGFNAICIGALGLSGFALLLTVSWMFR